MKSISQYIYSWFTSLSLTAFTDDDGLRLYPIAANAETPKPFMVYGISQQQGLTKDMDQFTVTLSAYFEFNEYDEAVDFSDTITAAVRGNSKFDYLNSEIGFVEENQSFTANVSFNIEE